MSGRAGRIVREGALWTGASVLVLGLHLGGALWIMRQAEAAAPPPGLPEPVFVDLAPAEAVAEQSVAPAEESVEPEPEPEPEVAEPLELPPLPELEPLDDMADLFPPAPPDLETPADVVLNASARPQRRPEREPEPQRQAEPRRKEQREPERQRQAEPRRQEQPAPQRQQARRADQGAGGSGASGPDPRQKASLMSQWGGQIRSCISRRASAPRGVREGGRVTLNLSVSRSGSIQGVGIAGSSGIAALDQAAVQAAQRAGRCPRAPAELTDASYSFQLPINLLVR